MMDGWERESEPQLPDIGKLGFRSIAEAELQALLNDINSSSGGSGGEDGNNNVHSTPKDPHRHGGEGERQMNHSGEHGVVRHSNRMEEMQHHNQVHLLQELQQKQAHEEQGKHSDSSLENTSGDQDKKDSLDEQTLQKFQQAMEKKTRAQMSHIMDIVLGHIEQTFTEYSNFSKSQISTLQREIRSMKRSSRSSAVRGTSYLSSSQQIQQEVQNLDSRIHELWDYVKTSQEEHGEAAIKNGRALKQIETTLANLGIAVHNLDQQMESSESESKRMEGMIREKEEEVLILAEQSAHLKEMMTQEIDMSTAYRGKIKATLDNYHILLKKCINDQQELHKRLESIETANERFRHEQSKIMNQLSQLQSLKEHVQLLDRSHISEMEELKSQMQSLRDAMDSIYRDRDLDRKKFETLQLEEFVKKTKDLEYKVERDVKPKLDDIINSGATVSHLMQRMDHELEDFNKRLEELNLQVWYGDSLMYSSSSSTSNSRGGASPSKGRTYEGMDFTDMALLDEIRQLNLKFRIPLRKLNRGMYELFGERVRIIVEDGRCMAIFMNEGMAPFKTVVQKRLGIAVGSPNNCSSSGKGMKTSKSSPAARRHSPRFVTAEGRAEHSPSVNSHPRTPRSSGTGDDSPISISTTLFASPMSSPRFSSPSNSRMLDSTGRDERSGPIGKQQAISIPTLQLDKIHYAAENLRDGHGNEGYEDDGNEELGRWTSRTWMPTNNSSRERVSARRSSGAYSAREPSSSARSRTSRDQPVSARLLRPTFSSSRKMKHPSGSNSNNRTTPRRAILSQQPKHSARRMRSRRGDQSETSPAIRAQSHDHRHHHGEEENEEYHSSDQNQHHHRDGDDDGRHWESPSMSRQGTTKQVSIDLLPT